MFSKHHRSSMIRLSMILILLGGMLGVTPARPVLASTLMVTTASDSGAGSLRQAIANAVSGDTIRFDPSLAGQTIMLSAPIALSSKKVILDGSGLSPQVIINGGSTAGIYLSGMSAVDIYGLTLTNFHSTFMPRLDTIIQNSTFKNFTNDVISSYASLTVTDSTFEGNNGRAIMASGAVTTITDTVLRNNTEEAIYATSASTSLIITHSTVSGNGGDAIRSGASATVIDSTITGNNGMGIMAAGPLLLKNTTIYQNSAEALTLNGTEATIINSTITQNHGDNGEILINAGDGVDIYNSTIVSDTNNTIFLNGTTLNLYNSILACRQDIECLHVNAGTVNKVSSFLFVNGTPGIGDLADNGGPTLTMALGQGSFLIDAGDNSVCAGAQVNGLDQRGMARPEDGDNNGTAICDIGAYEYKYVPDTTPPTVTAFTATTPSRTRNIPVTAFTASDNVAVKGYMITPTSAQPQAGAPGWSLWMAPTTFPVPADGIYTLYPWAMDARGNVSSRVEVPVTVMVDTVAPTVNTFTATSPSGSLSIPIPAFVAFDEFPLTYMVTTTSTPPAASASGWSSAAPMNYTVLSPGTYTLYPWVKDTADNVSSVFGTPVTVLVDTPPVVTSIARADDDPTSAASVEFIVTFSEPVSGVDIDDFALTFSDGIRDASITEVNGSEAVYTVTVNTGIGSGTLHLDVVDDHSIQDVVGNTLSAGFTAGEFYTIEKTADLPAQPTYLAPPAGYVTNDALLTFSWAAAANAAEYEIVFASDSSFSENAQFYFVTDPSFTPETPLADGKYYWHVRGYNLANEAGSWSAVRSFTVDALGPQVPLLQQPADNTSVRGTPTFRWGAVSEAVSYQFELDNDLDFSSPLISTEQRTTYRKPAGTLRGVYYWRVRARDAAGNWSEWSPFFTVTVLPSR